MKRSQVIALVLAVVAVGVMYSLPRVAVDSNEDGADLDAAETQVNSTQGGQIHDTPLNSGDRVALDLLIKSISEEKQSNNSLNLAEEIAAIYIKAGKYDSAAYYYEVAAGKLENIESWEKAGEAYYDAFTFALNEQKLNYLGEKTRNYLNKVLEKDPKRLDIKTKIAMTYVSSSNPMQGITMLREILEEDPTNEDGLYNMGVLSMQSGQYKRAAERFEELIKYHPEHIQGQFYLGVSYFESKQNNKAKRQFQAVQGMTQDPMVLASVEGYLERL